MEDILRIALNFLIKIVKEKREIIGIKSIINKYIKN